MLDERLPGIAGSPVEQNAVTCRQLIRKRPIGVLVFLSGRDNIEIGLRDEIGIYDYVGAAGPSGRFLWYYEDSLTAARRRFFWEVRLFRPHPNRLRRNSVDRGRLVGLQENQVLCSRHRGGHVPCFVGGVADGRQHTCKRCHRSCNTAVGHGYEAELEPSCNRSVAALLAERRRPSIKLTTAVAEPSK